MALALGSAGSAGDILGGWSDEVLFGGCVLSDLLARCFFALGMIGGWSDLSRALHQCEVSLV